MDRPLVIGIGGYTSNVGKTTLVCDLLTAFPGWEAIKTTRGHYRSCGKDPHACCVSHLLAAEPVVRSGREATYALGKDTGRYWDAGASNVHWLIATDDQVEPGIREALSRVKAEGVFIEGNSFARFVEVDFFVMVRREGEEKIKKSAKQVIDEADVVYVSDEKDPGQLIERVRSVVEKGASRGVA
jgi:molybdopterin-guanine dinucleotide biosynthesis protein